MNTQRYTTGIASAILLMAGLIMIQPVNAEDCYLDTDDNGTGDSTAGAESNGDNLRLACGRGVTATGERSLAVGYYPSATGWGSIAIGYQSDATDSHTIAVGYEAISGEYASIALGSFSGAKSDGSIALGYAVELDTTDSQGAIALGYHAEVNGTAPGAIAIGGDTGSDYVGAKATAANAIAIGADAVASVANTVILGSPLATTKVGINTSTPSNELDIRSHSPAIRLDDISADQGRVDLDMSDKEFAIEGNSNQDIVEIDTRAPEHALRVRRSGDVGIGIGWAEADLHVRGEGGGDNEELLRLESAVPPKMKLWNSGTGKNWTFGMNAINHLILSLNGTGKTEARFAPNGNLVIAGTLTENSDRDSKMAIAPVDNRKILDAVVKLPVSTWEYKREEGVKHLGPMAQDFHAAFGLGDDPKGISSIDTGGVALAAIKGLNEVVLAKDKEIESLRTESRQLKEANDEFRAANEELSARLTMLENLVNKLTAKEVVMNQ